MKLSFSEEEKRSVQVIIAHLTREHTAQGLEKLRALKYELYAAIPAHQRQSRGITWVLQRISQIFVMECDDPKQIRALADILHGSLSPDDMLVGIPIFLMAEYGKTDPSNVLDYFAQVAVSEDWVVREFAAAGLRKLIGPCCEVVLPWMKKAVQSDNPRLRRLVSEALRPVTENQWLNNEPETSLGILRLLFREAHPYPRTSVGNNLSDLARRNPDLILKIVKELVRSGDENSYWIAYRACRNMVKQNPEKIMNLLGVDEYHYKDRHFYRESKGVHNG
jgi:3-methyladenine DNA glycosylase AlkC